jgi:hypothetical protein
MLGDTVVEELTNFDTSSLKMAEPMLSRIMKDLGVDGNQVKQVAYVAKSIFLVVCR